MACPTEASYVQDGIVLVKKELCVGCLDCIDACPYSGARYLHPDGYVDKCTFCEHRITQGRNPACVEVCPTGSLIFGDLDDPKSEISKILAHREHKILKPSAETDPKSFLLTSTILRKKVIGKKSPDIQQPMQVVLSGNEEEKDVVKQDQSPHRGEEEDEDEGC